MAFEVDVAVDVTPGVGDGGVSNIGGVNALRQQGKDAKEIQILRVVIEAEGGLDFAGPKRRTSS